LILKTFLLYMLYTHKQSKKSQKKKFHRAYRRYNRATFFVCRFNQQDLTAGENLQPVLFSLV